MFFLSVKDAPRAKPLLLCVAVQDAADHERCRVLADDDHLRQFRHVDMGQIHRDRTITVRRPAHADPAFEIALRSIVHARTGREPSTPGIYTDAILSDATEQLALETHGLILWSVLFRRLTIAHARMA